MAKEIKERLTTATTVAGMILDIFVVTFYILYAGVIRIVKLFSPPVPRDIKGEVVLVSWSS